MRFTYSAVYKLWATIMRSLDDTIAAVASPPGGAARGIVRVSGPDAFGSVARFFRDDDPQQPSEPLRPRASSGALRLPQLFSPLPCQTYFWPAGRSYTGQAVVELHTIGSPPLLQALMRSLCAHGVRIAEPGEFTLRAFLAGRIDLSQAEAVLGVIDATDRRELDVALRQLAGGLARPLRRLRESLLDLLSRLEAGFDFADDDVPFIERGELLASLDEASRSVADTLDQMTSRGESVSLDNAVLIGRPNVGKSSLFNALAAGGAALVANQPGTTRDYLVAELDLDGIKCRLIDTAGKREEGRGERGEGVSLAVSHEPEATANSLAAELTQNAAIRVLCLDSTRQLDPWEIAALHTQDDRRIDVLTKCDVPAQFDLNNVVVRTSSATGDGVEKLRDELRRKLMAARGGDSEVVADTALRCRESLASVGRCLARARREACSERDELAAAEIRAALEELGRIIGVVYTDDVLDRIFSRFCIGK